MTHVTAPMAAHVTVCVAAHVTAPMAAHVTVCVAAHVTAHVLVVSLV